MCLTGVICFNLAKLLRDALDFIYLCLKSAGFYFMYSIVLGTFIAVKPRPEDCDCYGVSLVIPTGGLPELLRLLSLE